MSHWSKTPFGDLLVDSKDGEWGNGEATVGTRESIIIRGTDFNAIDNPATEFPRRWIKNHIVDRKSLQPGDLILETAGGTSTQSTGRTALLKKSFFENHAEIPVLCASFSRHLRLDTKRFSPRFIYYLLQTLYRFGYMAVFNIQHTGVSRFQFTDFKNHTKLQIPELPVQRRVAAILSTYDELIENSHRRIELLEKLAEEIYREWFVRFRFPEYKKAQFIKGFPKGWETKNLCQVAQVVDCLHTKKPDYLENGDGWLIQLENIGDNGRFNKSNKYLISKSDYDEWSNNIEVTEGDCLITNVGRIAAIAQIPTGVKAALGRNMTAVRPKLIPPSFLIQFLLSSHMREEVMQKQDLGAIMGALNVRAINKIKITIPPQKCLELFDAQVSPIRKNIWNLIDQIELMNHSRDLLLPRLISGKVSVENLAIQFPPGMAEELNEKPAQAHG